MNAPRSGARPLLNSYLHSRFETFVSKIRGTYDLHHTHNTACEALAALRKQGGAPEGLLVCQLFERFALDRRACQERGHDGDNAEQHNGTEAQAKATGLIQDIPNKGGTDDYGRTG
jgi:hypothetical protein